MLPCEQPRVGYVLKRYPRYSETFIINEILAHEAAGWEIDVFSLRAPTDISFPEQTARVRARVHQLPCEGRASEFWTALATATDVFPQFRSFIAEARHESAMAGCQAMVLADWARQNNISHLHAHFASGAATVARLAAQLAGLTYSLTAHAKDIFHESVDADDLARKFRDASAVITVSEYNREFLSERFPESAGHIHRIYNGLDLGEFTFSEPVRRDRRVLAVGRLVEKKGFADLINACALARNAGDPIACDIVGSGEEADALAAQIERLGLQHDVRLLGALPQSEVVRKIREAAVVAAPCVVGADGNRDGLPTVLLEAMALGTPVVSTDVTGIPELVRDGETGIIVPQRQPAVLRQALQLLLNRPDLQVRLATAGRKAIERDFDIRRNTEMMRGVIRSASRALSEVA
ncbi:MAG: glycosyltransferase [Gemmataceae bacterium]|nr:glycosyltransferase [Gemmataceae bacterium]